MCTDVCIHTRLSLPGGSPLMLAAHTSWDWMVIVHVINSRGVAATKQIETLASPRKLSAWRSISLR